MSLNWQLSFPEHSIFWLIVGVILGILTAMMIMAGFAGAQEEEDNTDEFVYDLYNNWFHSENEHTEYEWRQFTEAVKKLHVMCGEAEFIATHDSCDMVAEMYDDMFPQAAERGKDIVDKYLKDLIPRLMELETDDA